MCRIRPEISERIKKLMSANHIESAGKLAIAMAERGIIPLTYAPDGTDSLQTAIKRTSENCRKRISEHLKPNNTENISIEWLIRYAEFFNCSMDYLMGYTSLPDRENASVHDVTGLSDAAINKLKKIRNCNSITGFSNALSVIIEDSSFEKILELISISFMYDGMKHMEQQGPIEITEENMDRIKEYGEYIAHNEVEIEIENSENTPSHGSLRIRLPKDTLLKSQITGLISDRLDDYAAAYNAKYDSYLERKGRTTHLIDSIGRRTDLNDLQKREAYHQVMAMSGEKGEPDPVYIREPQPQPMINPETDELYEYDEEIRKYASYGWSIDQIQRYFLKKNLSIPGHMIEMIIDPDAQSLD